MKQQQHRPHHLPRIYTATTDGHNKSSKLSHSACFYRLQLPYGFDVRYAITAVSSHKQNDEKREWCERLQAPYVVFWDFLFGFFSSSFISFLKCIFTFMYWRHYLLSTFQQQENRKEKKMTFFTKSRWNSGRRYDATTNCFIAGGKKTCKKTQTSARLEERFMPWVIVAFLLNWKAAEVKVKENQNNKQIKLKIFWPYNERWRDTRREKWGISKI